jgi:hypothetical protein
MSVSPVTIERVMSDAQQAIAALPDTSDQKDPAPVLTIRSK